MSDGEIRVDVWYGNVLLLAVIEFMMLSVDDFIIVIVSVGESTRPSPINAKIWGGRGGCFFWKNKSPHRRGKFRIDECGPMDSFVKNEL
jgi:hypothetical protein